MNHVPYFAFVMFISLCLDPKHIYKVSHQFFEKLKLVFNISTLVINELQNERLFYIFY
jgi:hypothetical protein